MQLTAHVGGDAVTLARERIQDAMQRARLIYRSTVVTLPLVPGHTLAPAS